MKRKEKGIVESPLASRRVFIRRLTIDLIGEGIMAKRKVNPSDESHLYQVITKIAATTESRVVTSEELPLRLREVQHWPSLSEYLTGQEKQYIDLVVRACRDDKAKASEILGIEESRLG